MIVCVRVHACECFLPPTCSSPLPLLPCCVDSFCGFLQSWPFQMESFRGDIIALFTGSNPEGSLCTVITGPSFFSCLSLSHTFSLSLSLFLSFLYFWDMQPVISKQDWTCFHLRYISGSLAELTPVCLCQCYDKWGEWGRKEECQDNCTVSQEGHLTPACQFTSCHVMSCYSLCKRLG